MKVLMQNLARHINDGSLCALFLFIGLSLSACVATSPNSSSSTQSSSEDQSSVDALSSLRSSSSDSDSSTFSSVAISQGSSVANEQSSSESSSSAPMSAAASSSSVVVLMPDQCDTTAECRVNWPSATDCKNSASTQSVCFCGDERCDTTVSSSSSQSSAVSSEANCSSQVSLGQSEYQSRCSRCHGSVPTDGRTQWVNSGFQFDVFDSDNNGYQPNGGALQMLALGDFISLFMPSMTNNVGQPAGDNIAAYITHTVGKPWCPGNDWPEQIDESPNSSPFPLSVGKVQQESVVGLGSHAGCVIDQNKKAQCWGGNFMLPDNNTCRKSPENWGKGDCVSRAVAPDNLGKVVALSGSHVGACALRETPVNGRNIFCWGAKDRIHENYPAWNDAARLTGGNYFSCALRANGDVACWPSRYANDPFPAAPADLKAIAIAATHEAVCAIKDDQSVICWGINAPTPPADLRAKQVTVGGIDIGDSPSHHACAINTDDQVVCWGDGGGANAPDDIKAKSVAASADSTCAVLLSGQVQCWGPLNDIGGSDIVQNAKNGPRGSDYIQVNASRYSIIFTKADGSLVRFRDYNIKSKLSQTPATEATDLPDNIKVFRVQ